MDNLLGSYLLGAGLLGADPEETTDASAGGGSGASQNLLGGFFLGGTMLGADYGTGGGASPTLGNVFRLDPGVIRDAASVTGTLNEVVALRASVQGRTSVSGSLSQAAFATEQVHTGTNVQGSLTFSTSMSGAVRDVAAVSADLTKAAYFAGTTVHTSTTVTGVLQQSGLAGSVAGSTTPRGRLSLVEQLRAEAVRGQTLVAGRVGLATFVQTTTIACGTRLQANLTYASLLSGGAAVGKTGVTGTMLVSILKGQIKVGTKITLGPLIVRGKSAGDIHGSTTVRVVEGGLRRDLAALIRTDVQTSAGSTSVRGNPYITPQDFLPLFVYGSTSVAGQIGLRIGLSGAPFSERDFYGNRYGAITTITSVRGQVAGRVTISAAVRGRTTVVARLRFGTGAQIIGFGYVSANLGVQYYLDSTRVQTIHGYTEMVVKPPRNGTSGRAWGGTRFTVPGTGYGIPDSQIGFYVGGDQANDYFRSGAYNNHIYPNNYYYAEHFPTLNIGSGFDGTIRVSTRLHTLIVDRAYAHNLKGRAPFYGPYGFVSLVVAPMGDLGLGDFIDGSTQLLVSLLALRHRTLQLFGTTGVQMPGQITFVGDAVRGTGTRKVTASAAAQSQVGRAADPLAVYYV